MESVSLAQTGRFGEAAQPDTFTVTDASGRLVSLTIQTQMILDQ